MSIWLGGSCPARAVLAGGRRDEATPPVLRFSTLATGAVTVLIATGVYQTPARGAAGTSCSTPTTATCWWSLGIVGLAFLRRGGVADLGMADGQPGGTGPRSHLGRAGPVVDGRPDLRRLRLSVGLETLLLIGVLVATALLVTSDPARSSAPADRSPRRSRSALTTSGSRRSPTAPVGSRSPSTSPTMPVGRPSPGRSTPRSPWARSRSARFRSPGGDRLRPPHRPRQRPRAGRLRSPSPSVRRPSTRRRGTSTSRSSSPGVPESSADDSARSGVCLRRLGE
jgi:hypothetical protein